MREKGTNTIEIIPSDICPTALRFSWTATATNSYSIKGKTAPEEEYAALSGCDSLTCGEDGEMTCTTTFAAQQDSWTYYFGIYVNDCFEDEVQIVIPGGV